MKKFITSHSSDTDSGRFSGGATSSNSSLRAHDVNNTLLIKILIVPLSKQVYASVSSQALVNHVKQKLLEFFGLQIPDSINCGLFAPSYNGKNGKFLEEDRPIFAYITDDSSSNLEFTQKIRLYSAPRISSSDEDKSKNLSRSFLRAVARGDIKKVEKYLAKGFDPNFFCPRTEESPLSIAVSRPRLLEMLKTLIAGGAHKDFRIRNGITPLHKAASIGNFEAVKALLDFGQSPNILDANGLTPLYHNILGDVDTRICHRLLYEHAQIEIYDADGKQEIHQAAILGRIDQTNLLIMYGADVNARSLRRSQIELSGLLALSTRSTNKVNQVGNQCNGGHPQIHRLIGSGRETPLHYAAMAGQCATARRLLYWGADPTLTNDNGRTPIQEAKLRGNLEVAEIIRDFQGVTGTSARETGSSEGIICTPFLPAPTYNQKRKPMTAPLQVSALDNYVTLTPLGVERRGPSRSVTMPFPVSLSQQQVTSTETERHRLQQIKSLSSSSSLSLLHRLRSRACSEGDLTCSLEEKKTSSEEKGNAEEIRVQSSQERYKNPRRTSCHKISRGLNEIVNPTDCESPNHSRWRLRSWKSLHTLNEDSNIEGDEVADVMPVIPLTRPELRTRNRQLGNLAAMALNRFKMALDSKPSHERPWSSQDASVASAHVAKREAVYSQQSTTGQESAPIPANSSPIAANTFSRPVSPRQRYAHHFARSPIVSPSRSGTCSTARMTDCSLRVDPLGKGDRGITSTVVLHKAYLPDAPRILTLGLSLQTVQNVSAVQRFVPTPEKPSLQLIKNVKPSSPAFNAGLREGDYVIKINQVNVTRACHAEVVKLLDALKSNAVVLEVVRPKREHPCSSPTGHFTDSRHGTLAINTSFSSAKAVVQRSVSMAGRISHNNGPAPYSPMLPMHAPPQSRCISSEASTDDASCSQSDNKVSLRVVSPRITDGQLNICDPLRVYTTANYRIRHKFPNSKLVEAIRRPQLSGKDNHYQMSKSHTIDSFTKDISVDKSSLNYYNEATNSTNSALLYTTRSNYSNKLLLCHPVNSMSQPPFRFLPHYSSPTRLGHAMSVPRKRDRSSRHLTGNMRPVSMAGAGECFEAEPNLGNIQNVGFSVYPRSFSSMAENTTPRGSLDPNDLVLPPPDAFSQ